MKAMQRGDIDEYRRLAGPWRRSLRHNKQKWAEQVPSSGEVHLFRERKDTLTSSAS